MSEDIIDHFPLGQYLPPGKAQKRKTTLDFKGTDGLLPPSGVRNSGGRSAMSHRIFFPCRLKADGYRMRQLIAESAAEYGVALEALIQPNVFNYECQPLTVYWREGGKRRRHIWDARLTLDNGHQRLFYVKNGAALRQPESQALLQKIVAATPASAANDYVVVNADAYHRIRVGNLRRIYHSMQVPDPEADALVLETAYRLQNVWRIHELCQAVSVESHRAVNACFRLIGRGKLRASFDHILSHMSLVELPA